MAIVERLIVFKEGRHRKNFGEKLGGKRREDIRGFGGEMRR